jgi:RNA 2',3'-cyclic 3'-phosphodiesterase
MRLFVALDIPAAVRAVLAEMIEPLRPEAPGSRWSAAGALHITLKFLGHTNAQQLEPIRQALARIALPEQISVAFRGVGFFPDEKKPRVMWCGVEASENFFELAAAIEKALEPLGFERETRPYVPHVTLARLNSARNIEKLVRAAAPLKSYDFGAARESEFHLYESVLKPSGSEYKKLATFRFGEDAS